jgi:2'-5' RNA ligase
MVIRLEAVARSDEYFRCLFLRTDRSLALLAAHERALDVLGARVTGAHFVPHLSLVYGRLTAEEASDARETLGSIALPLALEVRRLEVHRTEGAVADWCRLATHPLTP